LIANEIKDILIVTKHSIEKLDKFLTA